MLGPCYYTLAYFKPSLQARKSLASGILLLYVFIVTRVTITYLVDFPFDGEALAAEATFAQTNQILVGTHFLRGYRLEIHFVSRTVLLERVSSAVS